MRIGPLASAVCNLSHLDPESVCPHMDDDSIACGVKQDIRAFARAGGGKDTYRVAWMMARRRRDSAGT